MSPKLHSAAMVFALSPALFSAEEPADLVKLREGYQKALTAKLTFNPELTAFEGVDFQTREAIKGRMVSPAQKASGGSGDSSAGAFGKPEK